MTETPSNQTKRAYIKCKDLPKEAEIRCSEWRRHFKYWRRFYFTTGTVGAIVSALAATQLAKDNRYGPYLAVVASICFAVLGFTHPERNYYQYVRAWRVLDVACQRFQYDPKFTVEQLLDALQHGEQIIAEVEHVAPPTLERSQKRPPDMHPQSKSFAPGQRSRRHRDASGASIRSY